MTFEADAGITMILDGNFSENYILADGELVNNADGDMSILTEADGELDADALFDGEFGDFYRVYSVDTYTGDYVVVPKAESATVLETKDKVMTDDVTVVQIPYIETSNVYGTTVFIARN